MHTGIPKTIDSKQKPELDRPGAGVSAMEVFLLSRVGKPLLSFLPWSYGINLFAHEGDRVLSLVADKSVLQLTTQGLVPRQLFLEDSSRYWSAAMVARHLISVGEKIARIILCLGKGEICTEPVNIAEVKPDSTTSATAFDEYREFLQRFLRLMREEVVNSRSLLTHPHPWSGQMNIHQWLYLAAIHQRIHRVQLQRILRVICFD